MAGIFKTLGEFMVYAATIGAFLGVLGRGFNMFIRAVSGKEDIF